MTKDNKFWITLGLIFILGSVVYAVPPKLNPLPSDYDTGITWQDAQKSDKPAIVNFYVDWCSACRKFAPILENLRKEFEQEYNFVIVKADDTKNASIVRQFRFYSYPSVFLFDGKNDKKVFLDQRKYFNMEEMRRELTDR